MINKMLINIQNQVRQIRLYYYLFADMRITNENSFILIKVSKLLYQYEHTFYTLDLV